MLCSKRAERRSGLEEIAAALRLDTWRLQAAFRATGDDREYRIAMAVVEEPETLAGVKDHERGLPLHSGASLGWRFGWMLARRIQQERDDGRLVDGVGGPINA